VRLEAVLAANLRLNGEPGPVGAVLVAVVVAGVVGTGGQSVPVTVTVEVTVAVTVTVGVDPVGAVDVPVAVALVEVGVGVLAPAFDETEK
jgi:hypothetical protein